MEQHFESRIFLFLEKPNVSDLCASPSYCTQIKGLELLELHLLSLAAELTLCSHQSYGLDTKCFMNCEE